MGLVIVVALTSGFALGAWYGDRHRTTIYLGTSQIPSAEYYSVENSFSDVQNARDELAGLSERYIAELRAQASAELAPAINPITVKARVIRDLQRALRELRGTPGEWVIAEELLRALRSSGQEERWLDLYLTAVYRAPTEPMIGRLAAQARGAARACGRQGELVRAWQQVAANRLEFASKQQVMIMLREIQPLMDSRGTVESGFLAAHPPSG